MMPNVCQPYPLADDASPLDLSKLRKGSERKQPPCETSSQHDPEVLDLSIQHPSTSRDLTGSYVAALNHQPDPEEPLKWGGSGVQSYENTGSDIVEDILLQLLE